MINYTSASNALKNAGYINTNKCHFDGETFRDFYNRKRGITVTLVIDECLGSVKRAEIVRFKWSDTHHRYEPSKETVLGLKELNEKIGAPRSVISF